MANITTHFVNGNNFVKTTQVIYHVLDLISKLKLTGVKVNRKKN